MLDVVVTQPQYIDHVLPVWRALGSAAGTWWTSPQLTVYTRSRGIDARALSGRISAPVLTAGIVDHNRARRFGATRFAYMEHGCGQSYGADARMTQHPAYAGGGGRDDVSLILAPNEHAAARWRARYPSVPVHVIGATRILSPPEDARRSLLCVSFHWDGAIPEMKSALPHYRASLEELARRVYVIGHGHPRAHGTLAAVYRRAGIEFVPDLEEVARRATVYAVDNSSTLWELGLTRPVIALDAPWYRRHVEHGLRFWSHVPLAVGSPDDLEAVADRLMTEGETPDERDVREAVCRDVIPDLDGARLASTLLMRWLT